MALDSKTAELAAKAKLHEKAVDWLITNDILTCEDVALPAAKEEQVDKSFIDTMLGEGVDEMKGAGKKIAAKKCWTYCRAVYDADRAPKVIDPAASIDDSIPDEHDVDVAATWLGRHKFVLPDAQFLIRTWGSSRTRSMEEPHHWHS